MVPRPHYLLIAEITRDAICWCPPPREGPCKWGWRGSGGNGDGCDGNFTPCGGNANVGCDPRGGCVEGGGEFDKGGQWLLLLLL